MPSYFRATMASTPPSIPKGTHDFGPQEMLRRKWIFSTIEQVFRLHGFLPLETPAMENLETLTGKYGEEGDRLIFKILNSGDAWKEVDANVKATLQRGDTVPPGRLAMELSGKALRYDLTVPFARYVVQHQQEITFPFKRYQIQPVWRADRPQKGRYREFYQCDADVIGSTSLLNEVELVFIILEVFDRLKIDVTIHLNNRKVLRGLVQLFGVEDRMVEFITIMDKRDKIGTEGILKAFAEGGFSEEVSRKVQDFYSRLVPMEEEKGPQNYATLAKMFSEANIAEGVKGLEEMATMLYEIANSSEGRGRRNVVHDLSLARGLDYYTGAIIEVKATEGSLQSSICGGGRYDDLTGVFGLPGVSGVGISFGADRIYDVLLELDRFPKDLTASTRLLFVNFGAKEAAHCIQLARQCREAGISAEVFPDEVKMKKQMSYADAKGIPFVALIGENEMKQGIVTVKDMKSGEQKAVKQDELIEMLKH